MSRWRRDVLDKKVILDPKDVISDKEKGAAYLSLRLDRISSDAKKAMLGIAREQLENLPNRFPMKTARRSFNRLKSSPCADLKILLDEGKELTLRLEADTKTGEVFVDATVEGMPKSALAEVFAQRQADDERIREHCRRRLRACASSQRPRCSPTRRRRH